MLRNLVAVFFWLSAIVIFIASIGAEVSRERDLLHNRSQKREGTRREVQRK
jgi:hypothetical protein